MSYPVQLYIYDLSQGMARSLGPALGLHDLEGEFDMILVRTNFLYLLMYLLLHTYLRNVYVRPWVFWQSETCEYSQVSITREACLTTMQ